MEDPKEINTNTLSNWLETGKEVSILDVRPIRDRTEWLGLVERKLEQEGKI